MPGGTRNMLCYRDLSHTVCSRNQHVPTRIPINHREDYLMALKHIPQLVTVADAAM